MLIQISMFSVWGILTEKKRPRRWRVDVILRTDAVSKVLRPSILLRLTLSNGDVRTMEVHSEGFLRSPTHRPKEL